MMRASSATVQPRAPPGLSERWSGSPNSVVGYSWRESATALRTRSSRWGARCQLQSRCRGALDIALNQVNGSIRTRPPLWMLTSALGRQRSRSDLYDCGSISQPLYSTSSGMFASASLQLHLHPAGPRPRSTRLRAPALTKFCAALTDPVPGKGWYDDVNGEIGDKCRLSSIFFD